MIKLTGRAINKVTIFNRTRETMVDLHFEVLDTDIKEPKWYALSTGAFNWGGLTETHPCILFECYEKSTVYNERNNTVIINKYDSGFGMEEGVLEIVMQGLENIKSSQYFTEIE